MVTRKEIDDLSDDIRKLEIYMVGLTMGETQRLLDRFAGQVRLLLERVAKEGIQE
jgi:hypothetical protein